MLKNRKTIKRNFTLLELIVSMGIFSILMLMLMQFFSSTQKIWTAAEKRNSIYGDARVAMDLMSSMLQTSFYQYNAVPFYIQKNTPAAGFDQIYFVTKTGTPLYPGTTSDLFEVKYYVDNTTDGRLPLRINMIGDNKSSVYNFATSPVNRTNITTDLDTATGTPAATNAPYFSDIINYVTGLTFTPFIKDTASGNGMTAVTTNYAYYPYAVQIQLTMIDKDTYKKWKVLNGNEANFAAETTTANELRVNNQRTFTRMVYLGDRNE